MEKEGVHYDRPADIRDLNNNVYTCVKYLAKGGFSKVYEIKQNKTRLYCGKYMQKENEKKKSKLSFLEEIRIHRRLKHPNVLSMIKCIEDPSFYCIILEYCHNKSLSELIKRRKGLTENEIRYYGKQILAGVRYIHSSNIVHRDLKPQNILINRQMVLKIGDFGLATTIRGRYSKIQKTIKCGTPDYMSPEMVNNMIVEYDYRVDIWAIGCILFSMVAGKPPFAGSTIGKLYDNIKTCNYVVPETVPKSMKHLICSILKVIPTKRPEINEIFLYPFFVNGFTPKMLPTSALYIAPRYVSERLKKRLESTMATIVIKSGISGNAKLSNMRSSIIIRTKRFNTPKTISSSSISCNKTCLRHLLRTIKNTYADIISPDMITPKWTESELETPHLGPVIWIQEFMDLRSIFGCLVYMLSNKIIGAIYDDDSIITLLPNNDVQYFNPQFNSKYVWKINDCPQSMKKKLDSLKAIYKNRVLESHKVLCEEGGEWINLMPQVTFFNYSKDFISLVLSTGSFQVNYEQTGMKSIICPKLKAFSILDKENTITTYGLNALAKHGHPEEIHKPLSDILQSIIQFLRRDPCFICGKPLVKKQTIIY